MKKKIISITFLIIGISIILYPKVNEYYNENKQQEILAQWEDVVKNLENKDEILEGDLGSLQAGEEVASEKEVLGENMEGILEIDKIGLKLPILTGATHENMKTSVASIENTGKAGKLGNYSIAGHRNLTYGRNFNRLDEISEGDILEVKTEDENYKYKVNNKLYVLPEDVWVLEGNERDKEITLVTCHPIGVASHRLIIKGKLVEKDI